MILGLKIPMENINMYMYLCTNFQEHWYLDTEDTHTRVITKLSIFLVFCVSVYFPPLLQPPSTKPPKLRKMAYNLLLNMMLNFIKCTHFSYRYLHTSNLCHHNFSNDLIRSLIPFNHPFSKCGHLNVTHYGIKIYVNG